MQIFPFSRYTISGHSMLPTLKPGQDILVFNWFANLKVGDLVVFKKEGKYILKRIKKIEGSKLRAEGDNLQDSQDFGWVKKSEVLGKVIWY